MGDISKHFSRREFACKCGCGFDTVDVELITVLETLRERFGQAVFINSGTRCPAHNEAVGGRPESQHLQGKAADVVVQWVHSDKVVKYLLDTYPNSYGIGGYKGRAHIDVRSGKARW